MVEFGNNKYIAKHCVFSFQKLEANQALSQAWVPGPALLFVSWVAEGESLPVSGPLSPQLESEAFGLHSGWGLPGSASRLMGFQVSGHLGGQTMPQGTLGPPWRTRTSGDHLSSDHRF